MELKTHEIEVLKAKYTKGTRIMLDYMNDSWALKPGSTGSVDFVDDIGNIHMIWDNGRTLALCPDVDEFHQI